ncbi:MAG: biotin--[acetyl-CoA-carboxylase] ligase [Clostridiales bacterium]|jgi:BirA family biotin operon repressor/biotin-[acetyl-CoA-carboxylase] ligase|nr:biotin--[acetyl-CoA-carboxylase] ligase [Clostridiales bacterium]
MHTVYVTKKIKSTLNVYIEESVTSTNDVMKEESYKPFDVLISKIQTLGKGRGDNAFVSNEGGLYMSILIPDNGKVGEIVTPLAGVAVARTLAEYGVVARLKWVNDVFVRDKKICGILAERIEKDGKGFIVLGIGLNVNNSDFGTLGSVATSMRLVTGADGYRISDILASLLDNITELLHSTKKEIIGAYRDLSMLTGKKVLVNETKEIVTVKGIDDNAYLVIETAKGTRTLLSGSITLLNIWEYK